jgi:hypothetical protein
MSLRSNPQVCAAILSPILAFGLVVTGCAAPDEGDAAEPGDADVAVDGGGSISAADGPRLSYPTAGLTDTIPGTAWTDADWAVFVDAVTTAADAGVAELPMGEAVARVGAMFVGWPYTPQTLEAPWIEAAAAGRAMDGSLERLVINLREYDCVSFVENTLSLTWFVRTHGASLLDDPAAARAAYEDLIVSLRYRGASMDGYASRLHYFSEWLSDNAARGGLELVHPTLGPAFDDEPIDFMTTHVDAYPALADDPESVSRIREMEMRLNAGLPRPWIPEGAIADVADRIHTGDVIAATSTVEGLDVAHTGIAIRVDGELRLMHAPLVGSEVQISPVSLAARIVDIAAQDGILVARPIER